MSGRRQKVGHSYRINQIIKVIIRLGDTRRGLQLITASVRGSGDRVTLACQGKRARVTGLANLKPILCYSGLNIKALSLRSGQQRNPRTSHFL